MAFVPIYILILAGTIIIDYIAGIIIENATGTRKRWFLILSIVSNVGILAVFKYYNFFADNINMLLSVGSVEHKVPLLTILLPIGLSFHTFQAMSYTIEVYRGNQKAERHFGIYALYVMFYPQLVAGPIERPQNVLHQFHEKHKFNYEDFVEGLKLMLWGFFKKTVIADRVAIVVNNVYAAPQKFDGVSLTLAVILFSFQLYCDFSAYSDIALGAARVMGFRLMVNFDRPFSSKSISEFWRRWHVSLSTWFNDYVYNPTVTTLRDWNKGAIAFALIMTFSLSGFWHGAGWKFVIYGLIHGIAIVYEFFTKKKRKKLFNKMPKWLNEGISKFLTLGYVAFSWIFFRAANFHDALYIIGHLGTGWTKLGSPAYLKHTLSSLDANGGEVYYGLFNVGISIFLIALLEFLQNKTQGKGVMSITNGKPLLARWSFLLFLIVSIFAFGVFSLNEFIYFQF